MLQSKSIFALLFSLLLVSPLALGQTPTAPSPVKKTKAAKKKKAAAPAPVVIEAPDSMPLEKATSTPPESNSSSEYLKFNVDSAPAPTDPRPAMQFSDPGESAPGTPRPEYTETTPDAVAFKTYPGYPKHQAGLYVKPSTLSSSWSYGGSTYNFRSPTLALGTGYRIQINPLWSMELDYMHYSMNLEAGVVLPFRFLASTTSFDDYSVKGNYCYIGKTSYYRKICPGFQIGNEGYPILNFVQGTSTNLNLSKVQDIIIGVNADYQEPFADKFLFKAIIGFNYGTGLGNSGYLTSKSNYSYYGDAGAEWSVTEHNIIQVFAEYRLRTAQISGQVGNITDKWDTKSSLLGAKIGYMRSW